MRLALLFDLDHTLMPFAVAPAKTASSAPR